MPEIRRQIRFECNTIGGKGAKLSAYRERRKEYYQALLDKDKAYEGAVFCGG